MTTGEKGFINYFDTLKHLEFDIIMILLFLASQIIWL